MKLLVIGGKLQGTEACYLAAKGGHEAVLVDRRPQPPAAGIAARHVVADITADEALARTLVRACDAVLPACEDEATLTWLAEHVPQWDVPLLFDLDAYRVTQSKLASQRLFEKLDVPRPVPWPACGFPAVVKPDAASGSEGVGVVHDADALAAATSRLEAAGHIVLVEEYLPGPSLSLEVLAWDGAAVPLQVTGLEFDDVYDCRRVVAPVAASAVVTPAALDALDAAGVRLAHGLGLNGLMDVEAMVCGDEPKVLEIDARLPSQTPTAVYWSSGLNIVELLAAMVVEGRVPSPDRAARRACVYEHVQARSGTLRRLGEHVMGSAAPLTLVPGFFGAAEALTDYSPGAADWSATLISTGADLAAAEARADDAVRALAAHEGLALYTDLGERARGQMS